MEREMHGDSKAKSHLYNTWRAMKSRCYNKHDKSYKWYGNEGIVVCDEWRYSYVKFKKWAENNGYKDGLTIERININGNYEPNNCCWKTIKEQANNRRDNISITYKGETKTLKQWAKHIGIPYQTLQFRVCDSGWNIDKAFTEPLAHVKNQEITNKILEIHSIHPEYSVYKISQLAGCGQTKVYKVLKSLTNKQEK